MKERCEDKIKLSDEPRMSEAEGVDGKFPQTFIPMEPRGNSPVSSDRKTNKKTVASSATAKPKGKSTASSAIVMKPNGKTAVSSTIPMKPNASTALSSAHGDEVMFFRDVTLGPHEAELRFCLIHFWEARNPHTKTLIGHEMLLIDEEGTVIQGFVPAGRFGTYKLTAGSVYKLNNFYGSRSKVQYRVADHIATVSFSWNSVLLDLEIPPIQFTKIGSGFIATRSFRPTVTAKVTFMVSPVELLLVFILRSLDYVGHMKLVNGQIIIDHTVLDEVDIAEKRHLCVQVQTHELNSNSDIANKINAEVVTKPEAVTLEELFSYVKQETAKVAWFECTATIDDVVHGSAWYYISCGGCNSKAVLGPTSLICNSKKCGKSAVTGVVQYLTKISVYDKSEQAFFVILGDACKELTGKYASELVASYFESNEGVGADHCVPVPQALLDTIGQTHKFIVKVSEHNLTGKTQIITVTKILPPESPHHISHLEEDAIPKTLDDILKTGSEESGPSRGFEDSAGDRVRKASESLESDEAKRSKSG
ncbi:hypothetical protein Bca52824_024163 [Brassica carinata]|uniref:Replication factor A C-terminal domain-containing protein n=1 Tax=Brassica carinata TaxID=52824 RepID=A0A8X7VJX8_BRACI|nr:hypothetical protein Bca52824_024163 [Brassica carinata]